MSWSNDAFNIGMMSAWAIKGIIEWIFKEDGLGTSTLFGALVIGLICLAFYGDVK